VQTFIHRIRYGCAAVATLFCLFSSIEPSSAEEASTKQSQAPCMDEQLPAAHLASTLVAMRNAAAILGSILLMSIPASAADRAEQIAHNEKLARRYFEEAWNRGDVAVLDELLAPDYVNHTPSTPNPPPGPEGLKPIILAMRRAFPDLHYEIKDVIATEHAVTIRVVMTGTHRPAGLAGRR
jgi:ketosteroid isomerase-like protein